MEAVFVACERWATGNFRASLTLAPASVVAGDAPRGEPRSVAAAAACCHIPSPAVGVVSAPRQFPRTGSSSEEEAVAARPPDHRAAVVAVADRRGQPARRRTRWAAARTGCEAVAAALAAVAGAAGLPRHHLSVAVAVAVVACFAKDATARPGRYSVAVAAA